MLLSLFFLRLNAQEDTDLIRYFKDQSIPVENIAERGNKIEIQVNYPLETDISMTGFENDFLIITKKIASEFPDSEVIHIDYLMDGTKFYYHELKTGTAVDYSNGVMSKEDMLSQTTGDAYEQAADSTAIPVSPIQSEQSGVQSKTDSPPPVSPIPSGGGGSPKRSTALDELTLTIVIGLGILLLVLMFLILRLRQRQQAQWTGKVNAILEIHFHDGRTKNFVIKSSPITIGRRATNTIVFNEESVSANHAEISVSGSKFFVTDLTSTNGTRVNGEKITKCELFLNDEIGIGNSTLALRN